MRIIKVDLTHRVITEEAFDQKDYGFLGGRGLVAKFLTDYCDPTCDPLGPENPLLFTTGYFSGTILTTSNRLSIGAKSPLTGGIKESNSGGTLARRMTDHQIKLIMFQGQSEDWVYLYIDKEGKPSNPVEVKTGLTDGENVEILSGLTEGQKFWYTYYDIVELNTSAEASKYTFR